MRLSGFLCLILATAAALADGPLPHTRKSIERGKNVFLRNCVACHDRDGKSYSGRDFTTIPPADLTDPESWKHDKSPAGIFASIKDGTKEEMPPYKEKLKDEEIWELVNFIRSIWPEAMRPPIKE